MRQTLSSHASNTPPDNHASSDINSVAPIFSQTTHTPPGKVKRRVIICGSQLCVTSIAGSTKKEGSRDGFVRVR